MCLQTRAFVFYWSWRADTGAVASVLDCNGLVCMYWIAMAVLDCNGLVLLSVLDCNGLVCIADAPSLRFSTLECTRTTRVLPSMRLHCEPQ